MFVGGVSVLSLFSYNVACLEGLLLVAMICTLFVFLLVSIVWLSVFLLYRFGHYNLGLPAMLPSVLVCLYFRLLQCQFQL